LKDKENDCNVLAEATIIKKIGDNLYLADYNGVKCAAIFNYFAGRYYVDDLYGLRIGAEGFARRFIRRGDKEMFNIRIDPEIKTEVEGIYARYGMSLTDAINIFIY
jgi:hypothetical protein